MTGYRDRKRSAAEASTIELAGKRVVNLTPRGIRLLLVIISQFQRGLPGARAGNRTVPPGVSLARPVRPRIPRCLPALQGAFYVLSQPLVEHIYRGREHYETFSNEDVTIGSWLLGVSETPRLMQRLRL